MAKVSIILPSYNHFDFLQDRLDSILHQTFTDWELIIIDDKSTDGSLDMLTHFVEQNKSKVNCFIVNDVNSGSGYYSWEKGIALAQSDYIWIAETDDYSDLNFLEVLVGILEQHKNCALAFCASNYVDVNKQFLYNTDRRTQDLDVVANGYKVFDRKVFIDKMPFDPYITNGSSVVFRNPKSRIPQEVFVHRQCSDLFLWTFLLQQSSFLFLNKKLNYFRRHEASTTTTLSSGKPFIGTFKEMVFYLEYFNFTDKYASFITYYFNNYLWNNKREVFHLNVFGSAKELKKMYFQKLLPLLVKKFFHGK